MKKQFIFLACLCAFIVLGSHQAYAALVSMTELSSFDQAGTFFVNDAGGYYTSTNYAAMSNGSWHFEGHAVSFTQNGGTFDISFGTGLLAFYYDGERYTSSMSGSGTLTFGYSWNGSAWVLNPDLSPISITGSGPINDSSSNYTGFSIYTSAMQGHIDYNNSVQGSPDFGGEITSLAGQITGSPVPIPAALWLFGSGLLGLSGMRRITNRRSPCR